MPLVFVHGVNVREGTAYQKEVLLRNRYLSNIFLKSLGKNIAADDIFSPYWGDLATVVSPGLPFLPSFATPVSTTKKVLEQLVSTDGSSSKLSLLKLARQQPLDEVVDLIIAAAADEEAEGICDIDLAEGIDQLSEVAYGALQISKQFRDMDDQLAWLDGIKDDAQLMGKLESEIENKEARTGEERVAAGKGFGRMRKAVSWMQEHWTERRNSLKETMEDVGQRTLARAKEDLEKVREVRKRTVARAKEDLAKMRSTARNSVKTIDAARRRTATHISAATITHPLRKMVHDRLFLFIGDAFLYFGHRGTPDNPGPIVQRIIDTIDSANAAIDPANDPELIVIAHSMGGNITCDVLSHFYNGRPIDLVITVGSQFPLFADLHMFPGLDTRQRPIHMPPSVKRWINVYDVNDVFGFAATPMFAGIEDIEYTSGRFGVATHADCFKFVSLYERMAQAVQQPSVPARVKG